jgi:hypothetical protein
MYPFPLSNITAAGEPPVVIDATTVFVEPEITLRFSPSAFATYTSPLAGSYATSHGPWPTGTDATTLLVVPEITLTLLLLAFPT